MTTEIHIRNCRIEARPAPGSGLSWADREAHRAFAQRVQTFVLEMLDALLLPHLAGLAPDALPRALALDLRLDVRDLVGAAPLARRDLRDRASMAIAAAIARTPAPDPEPPPAPAGPDGEAVADSPASVLDAGHAGPLELLLAWHRERQLEYRLALFSGAVLVRLIETILAELDGKRAVTRGGPGAPAPPPRPAPAVAGSVRRAVRNALQALVEARAAAAASGAGRVDAARLKRTAAAAERVLSRAAEARARINRRARAAARPAPDDGGETNVPAPLEAKSSTAVPAAAGDDPVRASEPGLPSLHPPSRPPAGRSGATAPLRDGQHQLESALPFLALQSLARHGIPAAAAVLSGDGRGDEAILGLAFAIGLRAQGPPAEGGRWSVAQLADAAALAGRAVPLEGPELLAAARHGGEICDAAAGTVGGTLIAGHKPGLPLPLLADAGRLVVFESEGLFPLCRLSGLRVAEAFAGRNEAFFVADPDAALLREIDAAGLAAIASAPPARGESWRPAVAGRGWRGMTNLAPERFAALVPGLPETERAARRAAEVWRALTVERPLLAGSALDEDYLEFDRTSALLAGFALADIAWTLFERDAAAWAEPDPLLAVERFADLSATVEVTPSQVIVSLPLGARFADLRDAGLLDTIGGIPWWPGRTIAFQGG